MKRSLRQPELTEAFERIVSHYEARLIRYAARITGSGDTAQDVVQDTFIRLFRRWEGELEPSSALSGWLYRVAHNRAVDAVRHHSRRTEAETKLAEQQPESIPPSAAVRGGEACAERAKAALRTLDARERQLVMLKVYEEKSYREISEITGLTSGNVGYILHHAMKKMAAAIKNGGDP